MKKISAILSFLILFFLVDYLLFGVLFWKLPNESPWNSSHFYNALYEIKNAPPKKAKRIVFVGSSLVYYSVNQAVVREKLKQATGETFELVFVSFAGMTPFDSYMMKDVILGLEPDLVVYPLNFIDFRLHRPYLLGDTAQTVAEEKMLLDDSLNLAEAPQSLYFYPWQVLREYLFAIGIQRSAVYLSAAISDTFRYRLLAMGAVAEMISHRFGRNTSYHGYMGVQMPQRVNARGWTGQEFVFQPTEKIRKEGIWLEVVPEIADRDFFIRFDAENNSQKFYFPTPGWKHISSPVFSAQNVTARLAKTWQPIESQGHLFDYLHDRLGVRLPQTFGRQNPPSGLYFHREERLEDLRFDQMTEREYKSYFNEYLLKDPEKRPGIAYLHALKTAKEKVSREVFRRSFQFVYLQKLVAQLSVPVLLVNHPENPLSLAWYGDSVWYLGYLDFMRQLNANKIDFIDMKNKLEMRDFLDYHHITWKASLVFSDFLSEIIIKKFMTQETVVK